jgi:hypothetical protein
MIRHGGVVLKMPNNLIAQPEPQRTDNFKPATITASDNGNIKPPSILPLVFGAGLAVLFIVYNKNANSNFTLNFR